MTSGGAVAKGGDSLFLVLTQQVDDDPRITQNRDGIGQGRLSLESFSPWSYDRSRMLNQIFYPSPIKTDDLCEPIDDN